MRLSQIKLAGFKSFVDPTNIPMPGQIVGVVGPNGCGKSNVIDALRWVLGESKASALRGESMQDVIFNGSSKRKPVSRASVELVFDNALGKAAGQWSSYAEIAIKRILQRDGKSTYMINNQVVRRKDITDIFLGTGLGSRAYAIIEQGMISRIIEAKPEELRVFLEEAAGVSRYRDRRRETEARIADTRDNLLRVGDVLQELEKQLEHLAAQAEVAKQYHALKNQRDTAQHLFWLLKKQDAETQQQKYVQLTDITRNELENETAQLRQIEGQLEYLRQSHYQLSDEVHNKQGELYAVNAEIAQLEQQIKHVAQHQQRLSQQIRQNQQQQEQQQQQRDALLDLQEHWQGQQQEAEMQLEYAEQTSALTGQNLPQAEQATKLAQDQYHHLQRELLKLQQQEVLANNQLQNTRRNLQQLGARQQRLVQEKANLPAPDTSALEEAQLQQAELDCERSQQLSELAELQARLPSLEQIRRDQQTQLQQHERSLAQSEARLQALLQIQRQAENDKKLQTWLQQHQLEKLPRLWQNLHIQAGWEKALEAVLSERLNAIALDSLEVALNWQPPAKLAVYQTVAAESEINVWTQAPCSPRKPLLDYVTANNNPALTAWLSHVYVADDVSSAYAQRAQLPDHARFVTPQGHLISAHSVVFFAPDNQLHGILARQREIEQLQEQLAVQQAQQLQLREQLKQAEQQYRETEQKIVPLRSLSNELQQRLHSLQMQIFKLTQAQERSQERSSQISAELEEVLEQIQEEQIQQQQIEQTIAENSEYIHAAEAQLETAKQQARQLEQDLHEQRHTAQQSQHLLQEARFFAKTCKDKLSDLQHNLNQASASLEQLVYNRSNLEEELLGHSDNDAHQQLQQQLHGRQQAEQALALARNNLENASLTLQQLEQARLTSEHKLNPLRDKLNDYTLKEQAARLHYEQWQEQLQNIDEAPLFALLATHSYKTQALQNELHRLDAAINALGAVNLAALAELESASERKNYLESQALDLNQALATLEEAIRHIDKESRELLMETYNQVNQHLAEKFPILFNGGEAKLVLTGDEILDSGVQVMAQPPGKKNSTIHLMSGGEKALTAIALVFSLFQLNPAPFCLLDEVDAPLDDANTERLCALIKTMAQHTQFVFISHNRIAMEMAQQLIGVTMQEQGVSKVVAVDIEEALRMSEQ